MSQTAAYKDKVVAITGAGSGMGRSLAIRFGQDGAQLALVDLDEKTLKETVKQAKQAGATKVLSQKLDVSDREAVLAWAEKVQSELGPADVLINNAGIAYVADFETQDLEYFERVMNVNFWGVVWGSRAFLPQLRKTGGSLINTSSVFGLVGARNTSAYCAAKFAVRGLSETLWQELQDAGVHVGSVHPGGIKTNIVANARVDQQTNEDLSKQFDELAPTTSDQAAEIIYTGIHKRKKRIMVGKDAKMLQWIVRLFPTRYASMIPLLRGSADEV